MSKLPAPVPNDEATFFERGKVAFVLRDFPSRTAVLEITAPCCLFHALTPQLLGAGLIDHPSIAQPVQAWMPKLSPEQMNSVAKQVPNADVQANFAVEKWLENIMKVFEGVAQLVNDPSFLVPMLPLGIYVTWKWRCRIDDILKVLEGIQAQSHVAGVIEFQWALATVLHCVLNDYQMWESRQKNPGLRIGP